MESINWIEVDRAGLAQVIADRPKEFILFELIQNALDEDTTHIQVHVESVSRGRVIITVEDNSPNGYEDIRHAWTLYAPSKKKGDPELRGRFNIGCKMVLALAESATIISTKSAVTFSAADGRRLLRSRRETGTQFSGIFKMTKQEASDAIEAVLTLLPPDGVLIETTADLGRTDEQYHAVVNHSVPCDRIVVVALPTVFADAEGVLRNTKRNTEVELYEVEKNEMPHLYELGIPVVELDGDDPWHVNVLQRVPLNVDRDNVTPAYLRTLRVAILNATAEHLDEEQALGVWATEASEDERVDDEAIDTILTHRFGARRVAYDPSDPEANKLAASKGFTVVPGGALTKGQWNNAKRAVAIKPAGQVTPSPTVASSPDGVPPVDPAKWTKAMGEVASFAIKLCAQLGVSSTLFVTWYNSRNLNWAGAWGGDLSLNKAKLGHALREWGEGRRQKILELLIHEFGHEESTDHLSSEYYKELCRLGAKLYYLED